MSKLKIRDKKFLKKKQTKESKGKNLSNRRDLYIKEEE